MFTIDLLHSNLLLHKIRRPGRRLLRTIRTEKGELNLREEGGERKVAGNQA